MDVTIAVHMSSVKLVSMMATDCEIHGITMSAVYQGLDGQSHTPMMIY